MKHSVLRRLGALALALALAVPLASGPAQAASGPADDPIVRIELNETAIELTYDNDAKEPPSFQLIAYSISAAGQRTRLMGNTLIWSIDNENAAEVRSNGKVTAKKQDLPGSSIATVTAKLKDDETMTAACQVTVITPPPAPEPVNSVRIDRTDSSYQTGVSQINLNLPRNATKPVTAQVSATVTYDSHTDHEVVWEVFDPNQAITFDQATGLITAVGGGTAVITAKAKADEKKTASVTVTVTAYGVINVTGVTVSKQELKLGLAESDTLTAAVQPSSVKDKTLSITTEPLGIVDVADVNGKGQQFRVTGVGLGKAKITFTSVFDPTKSAVCEVEVTPALKTLTIDGKNSDNQLILTGVGPGDHKLIHAVPGSNGYGAPSYNAANINWTSSDASVFTVQKDSSYANGCYARINLVAPGKAELTVQYGKDENIKDTVEVEVPGILLDTTSGVLNMVNNALTMQVGQTEQLVIKSFGSASGDSSLRPTWFSTDTSIVTADNGKLIARTVGTATVEVTRGSYTAKCTVTVREDTSTLITASGTYSSGRPLALSSLQSQLNTACVTKTESALSYVTNLSVPTAQGILHNTHRSEADTGAGIGATEKYYPGRTGLDSLSAVSFVPRADFSGTAEISYTGVGSNGRSFDGTIRVAVSGTGQGGGDVSYSSNGSPVSFVADDFSSVISAKTGRSLKYLTFTPPQSSVGTLYYGYIDDSHPGEKVQSATQYRRAGSPSLDKVSFVPADGYQGTVRISYRAVDTADTPYTGTVTINVTRQNATRDPADIFYYAPQDGWAVFQARDFSAASLRVIGETLSYVRFELPPSSEGTLFHNYRGYGSYDSAVTSTTDYRVNGSPALDRVAFVPATTASGQMTVRYTGYSVRGTAFTGTVYINPGSGWNDNNQVQDDTWYRVNSGASVNLNAYDFNNACVAATGASLSYIRFTQLPAIGQGTLRYRSGNSNIYGNVQVNTSYYRVSSNSWDVLIGNISFQAAKTFTGTVRIPYTGYNTNGVSYTDEVVIQVTPTIISYSGSSSSPIGLSAARVRSAHSGVLTGQLSYIIFTSLPDPSAGQLYLNYSGFGSGSQVNTGTRYYATGNPNIDQISFVPRGRYQGEATAAYTAVSTTGEQVNGQFAFYISSSSGSGYFTDMGGHTWAAASVDYLYQNGVTNGITATTFGPGQRILRRDFVLMLCRAFHFSGGSGYSFADVPSNAYYAQAVATAKRLGIVNGDGTNFMPNAQLTRQDAMVMIKNSLDAAGVSQPAPSATVLSRFPDNGSISSYARSAVSVLVQMGAVNGDDKGMMNPRSYITRAEAAVILHYVMTM